MEILNCLILENIAKDIHITKNEDNSYVYEGIFTVFDIRNENGRFYRKNQFLPFVQKLQPLIERNKLLGELDHPNDFTVKYGRASHIIEKLEYDSEKNAIIGRIRLLDTEKGKDAKALADAGVPLNVSSRASGKVLECGDVELNALYTYDLVADPSCKEAELRSINESIDDTECTRIMKLVESFNNFEPEQNKMELITEHSNKDLRIYKINEINKETDNNQSSMNNNEKIKEGIDTNNEFVKASALKKWSDDVCESIEDTQSKINELEKTLTESTVKNSDMNSIIEMFEQLNSKIDSIKEHVTTELATNDKYLNYLRENIETTANYAETHLKENIERIGNYSEGHLANELEKTQNYVTGYLKEQVEKIGTYTESYIASEINKVYEYNDNYLRPKITGLAKRTELLESKLDKEETPIEKVEEGKKETKSIDEWKNSISTNIQSILESAKKETAGAPETTSIIEESKSQDQPQVKTLIAFMPENIKAKYEALSEGKKNEIELLSENYELTTPYQVDYFWNNVDFTESAPIKENKKMVIESKEQVKGDLSEYGIDSNELISYLKR